jgi:hypothetical protein
VAATVVGTVSQPPRKGAARPDAVFVGVRLRFVGSSSNPRVFGLGALPRSSEIKKTGNAEPPLTDVEEKVSATVQLVRISRRRIRLGCSVAAEETS